MNLQHVQVKFYAEESKSLDLEVLIPVLHSWIQEQNQEELLIDVADYRHVPRGPGIVLIGHHANYSMEPGPEDRMGLLYATKVVREGSEVDKVSHALKRAIAGCKKLEADGNLTGKVRFLASDLRLIINDRLLVPNTEASFKALESSLVNALKKISGKNYTLKRESLDPRERLTVHALSDAKIYVQDLN